MIPISPAASRECIRALKAYIAGYMRGRLGMTDFALFISFAPQTANILKLSNINCHVGGIMI
jgi:hypothetical protein